MSTAELKKLALGLAADRRVQAWAGPVAVGVVAFYLLAPGFFLGVLFGVASLLAAQFLGLSYLWSVIKPKPKEPSVHKDVVGQTEDGHESEFLESSELESAMWVCSRPCMVEDDTLGHSKLRKSVKGFNPLFRRAQLDGLKLVLTGPGGVLEVVQLHGCQVKAYSETEDAKKKWNRKFPVRIRNESRELWQQSRELFVYFPNGWQKELWCLLLRRAIRMGNDTAPSGIDPGWQHQVKREFSQYRHKVTVTYPDSFGLSSSHGSSGGALDIRGDGIEGLEARGLSMSALGTRRWRRRNKGGKQGEDWEGTGHSWGGPHSVSWASTGALDKSQIAPPLGMEPEANRLRNKIKSFVASKRAQLQDKAQRHLFSDSSSENRGGGQAPSGGGAPPGDAGGQTVKDVLESRVKDLNCDILEPLDSARGNPASDLAGFRADSADSEEGGWDSKRSLDADKSDAPALWASAASGGGGPQAQSRAESDAPGLLSGGFLSDTGRAMSVGEGGPLESAVCALNVLASRLFFDLHYQGIISKKLQEKLQEKLGLILTPSGIGPLSCSKFDFGSSPPLLKALRPSTEAAGLPEGFYSMDADLVYQGKVTFTIETRLELKDSPYFGGEGQGHEEGGEGQAPEECGEEQEAEAEDAGGGVSYMGTEGLAGGEGSGKAEEEGKAAPGLDSDFGLAKLRMNSSSEEDGERVVVRGPRGAMATETQEPQNGILYMGVSAAGKNKAPAQGVKDFRSTSTGKSSSKTQKFGRFKDILATMASGLSQVPLSITVNVTGVKGTLRIRVPPPPTDRLWLAFVEMPDLSLSFVPSIGEKQLKRFPLATKIVDKLKELVRRTQVLPACNDVPLPFMTTDSDDWLPREARMLPWRPAAIPPPSNKVGPEAFPPSIIDAFSDFGSFSMKQAGESEVAWEDDPRPGDGGSGGAMKGLHGAAKSTNPGVENRELPASLSWRTGPRMTSPLKGNPSSTAKDAQAPAGRTLQLAAKIQSAAANLVKAAPVPSATGARAGDGIHASGPSQLTPGSTLAKADLRAAAERLLRRRELPPAPVDGSTPQTGLAPGAGAVSGMGVAEGSSTLEDQGRVPPHPPQEDRGSLRHSPELDGRAASQERLARASGTAEPTKEHVPVLAPSPGFFHVDDFPGSYGAPLARISERSHGEERSLRRASSEPDIDEMPAPLWNTTPLAAHRNSMTVEENERQPLVELVASEATAIKPASPPSAAMVELLNLKTEGGRLSSVRSSTKSSDPEARHEEVTQPKEWHGAAGSSMSESELAGKGTAHGPLQTPGQQGDLMALEPRASEGGIQPATAQQMSTGDSRAIVGRSWPLGEPGVGGELRASFLSLPAEDEARRDPSSGRLQATEQWRNKAKDLVGKLGDKEARAHATQVVGQVVGEKASQAKEKAKKFVSFLKDKHAATVAARQQWQDE